MSTGAAGLTRFGKAVAERSVRNLVLIQQTETCIGYDKRVKHIRFVDTVHIESGDPTFLLITNVMI